MKKTIIVLVAALLSVATFAQPRAIGGRLTAGVEASYQHYLGSNFAEIDLGWSLGSGFGLTGIYDFVIAQPDWTDRGTWDFYAGPGITLGSYFKELPFAIGVAGQVGLSYTFWFPLQLSADLRPVFSVGFGPDGAGFNASGMFGFVPTIGVRYSFGQ